MVEDLDAGGVRGVYSSRSKLDIGDGGHIECMLSQFFDPRGMFNLFWLCLQERGSEFGKRSSEQSLLLRGTPCSAIQLHF